MMKARTLSAINLLLVTFVVAASFAAGDERTPTDGGRHRLELERIDILGLESLSITEVLDRLELHEGLFVDQDGILAAIERLESSGLFADIEFYTRPGSARGRITLVLELIEATRRTAVGDVRFGAGTGDVDGWYAIPLQVNFSHLLQRNDVLSLRIVLGYRLAGTELSYRSGGLFGGPGWWGVRARGLSVQRVYFDGGIEIGHKVDRSGFSLLAGQPLGRRWQLEMELGRESVDPRDNAQVYIKNESLGVEAGDDIPLENLPPEIRSAVDAALNNVASVSLTYDARSTHRIADTPTGGFWGRLSLRGTGADAGEYAQAGLDLRTSRAWGRHAFALRVRGSLVTADAPFYDRLYLGGLYTVRGYPSQSLSLPAGATWLWSASLELRKPLTGDADRPGLAGSLFLDVGDTEHRLMDDGGPAVGLGWGLRWRLLGILLGADLAIPVSDTPVNEAFHGNVSVGWSF